jgi:hypothetical protein
LGDDNLWYFFTADELIFPAAVSDLKNELTGALSRLNAEGGYVVRYQLLNSYSTNYPFVSATFAGASAFVRFISPTISFPHYISASLLCGYSVFGIITLVVVTVVAIWHSSPALKIGMVLSISIEALISPVAGGTFAPFHEAGFFRGISRALYFLAVPGPELNIFNIGPRNLLAGLILAACMLRWSRRSTASYWMLFCLAFVHQSSVLMVVFFFACVDLVLRPIALLRSIAPIALTFILVVFREKIWHLTGISWPLLSSALLVTAILIGGALWLSIHRPQMPTGLEKLRSYLSNGEPAFVDTSAFLIVWIATLPAPYFINQHVDAAQSYYFWSVLHTRSLGLLHPSLLMGVIAATLIRFPPRRWIENSLVLVLLCAALLQAVFINFPTMRNPLPNLQRQAWNLQRRIEEMDSVRSRETLYDGTLVYYGLIMSAEGANDRFARLLKAAPNSIQKN